MLRIKRIIEESGRSQAKIARDANVNQTSLSRIVNGKEPPFPQRGRRIAEALGWRGNVDELFEEVPDDGAR